jgi:hypothetical protein
MEDPTQVEEEAFVMCLSIINSTLHFRRDRLINVVHWVLSRANPHDSDFTTTATNLIARIDNHFKELRRA